MSKSFGPYYWVHLPYCLIRRQDGLYLPVNRRYKPLGQLSPDWVDYETHPGALKLEMTPALARQLSYEGQDNLERIFLFRDGICSPKEPEHRPAYWARLELLMREEVHV